MRHKFKPGDKVWVKAVVTTSSRANDGETEVRVRTSWDEETFVIAKTDDVRPRVKRKPPASPWQPIETAPKDGTVILITTRDWLADASLPLVPARWIAVGHETGWVDSSRDPRYDWCPLLSPTHWMPIPKLEVE